MPQNYSIIDLDYKLKSKIH